MSEPFFDDYIDWSQGDLLDACYANDTIDPRLLAAGVDHGGNDKTLGVWSASSDLSSEAKSNVGIPAYSLVQMPPFLSSEEVETINSPTIDLAHLDPIYDDGSLLGTMGEPTDSGMQESTWLFKSPLKCTTCHRTSQYSWVLDNHAKRAGHFAFRCNIHGCNEEFFTIRESRAHQGYPHILGHGRVGSDKPFDCSQCHTSLKSKAELLRHAKVEQHQPYACKCGVQFSRIDVLNRHLVSNDTETPKYPCKYCQRHRGAEAFRRKDHLTQHIRNYHHLEIDPETDKPLGSDRIKYNFPVCSHEECPQYRGVEFKKLPPSEQKKAKPFVSQSEYTKHMKDEHNECTFPCDVPGCPRIGRKGYFREKDLLKHRNEKHPDAAPYVVLKREPRVACTEPGCNAKLCDGQAMASHRYIRHGIGDIACTEPGCNATFDSVDSVDLHYYRRHILGN